MCMHVQSCRKISNYTFVRWSGQFGEMKECACVLLLSSLFCISLVAWEGEYPALIFEYQVVGFTIVVRTADYVPRHAPRQIVAKTGGGSRDP